MENYESKMKFMRQSVIEDFKKIDLSQENENFRPEMSDIIIKAHDLYNYWCRQMEENIKLVENQQP